MKNSEIARMFYEMADILEMQNVQWKPKAYRKAARNIEAMSTAIEDIYSKGGIEGLEQISGVGEHLAKKIEEYLKTGKMKEYDRMMRSVPEGLTLLTRIPGVGPKKAKEIYGHLKIKSVRDLEKAAREHRISAIPHFKAKSEENILRGIEMLKVSSGRTPLGMALPMAEDIMSELKSLRQVGRIDVAGSIRRGRESAKDIDILITSRNPKPVMDYFIAMKDVKEVLAHGPTKSSVIMRNGMQVDLRVMDEKSYGSAMQYFTGSKDHNVALRQIAIAKGYKLSEYGLFDRKTDKFLAGGNEKDIYRKLGMKLIPPELRENNGELEAAKKNLPKLVELKDIKGDLHMHTNYSDGSDSVEDMIKAAKALGYEYIAITDHSRSETIAHGLKVDRLLEYNKDIKRIASKFKGIKVFTGSEVNILADGTLDYDDGTLKKLDFVIGSVHRNFKLTNDQMTKRLVKAISSGRLNVLGHPTARELFNREPIVFDFEKVCSAAKENNVALEIDSQPRRLDLDYLHVKEAVSQGVKIIIDTDSHNAASLGQYMRLGVITARKGWCTKADVINTRSLSEFAKLFKLKL
ncbi:MAG: DNA polymerase/3'-5' exonuclease PolX [Candidatus Woesearchaeota archaeon]